MVKDQNRETVESPALETFKLRPEAPQGSPLEVLRNCTEAAAAALSHL